MYDDLWFLVFSFLQPKYLIVNEQVCSRFFKIINEASVFWHEIRLCRPTTLQYHRYFSKLKYCSKLTIPIQLLGRMYSSVSPHLTTLHLVIKNQIATHNLIFLISHFSRLEYLTLDFLQCTQIDTNSSFNCTFNPFIKSVSILFKNDNNLLLNNFWLHSLTKSIIKDQVTTEVDFYCTPFVPAQIVYHLHNLSNIQELRLGLINDLHASKIKVLLLKNPSIKVLELTIEYTVNLSFLNTIFTSLPFLESLTLCFFHLHTVRVDLYETSKPLTNNILKKTKLKFVYDETNSYNTSIDCASIITQYCFAFANQLSQVYCTNGWINFFDTNVPQSNIPNTVTHMVLSYYYQPFPIHFSHYSQLQSLKIKFDCISGTNTILDLCNSLPCLHSLSCLSVVAELSDTYLFIVQLQCIQLPPSLKQIEFKYDTIHFPPVLRAINQIRKVFSHYLDSKCFQFARELFPQSVFFPGKINV